MRNLKSLRAATLLASLLTVSLPLSAQTSNEQIQALREQIQQLDQKLRILERQNELRQEAATAAAAAASVVAAGPAAFSLTSGDRLFQLRIAGLLHADARFYGSDAPASDTFLLRRVRPTFQGTFNGKFGFRITPEFAGNNATLLDASVSYAASPAFNVLIGKAKSPFDFERLVSGGSIRFIERAYPTILGPNRDIGIQITGDVLDRRLNYALAWSNGTGDNGSSVTNTEADTELALRLFAQPFIADTNSPLAGLGFGVAFTYGDKSAGAPAGYSTLAQQGFFAWNGGVANSGRHFRWSP